MSKATPKKGTPAKQTAKFKLRKGDKVVILSGKDKGKQGTILRVLPNDAKVVVEGAGMAKRHQKGTQGGQSGRIVEKELPMHISNVALMDPESKKATRVGRRLEGGKLVRYAKKSGAALK